MDSDNFHFTDILYKGKDIHDIMQEVERERFIVPKEIFMKINRRQMAIPLNVTTSSKGEGEGEKRKLEASHPPESRGGRGRGRGRPRKYL